MRAARLIDAGEELTIAYIDVQAPLSHRREQLSFGYGFMCECELCLFEGSERSQS